MSDHIDYDSIRADTVWRVAKLMAAAAITAPKSGGQLFLAGKHLFIETVIVDDRETLDRLAGWMRSVSRPVDIALTATARRSGPSKVNEHPRRSALSTRGA